MKRGRILLAWVILLLLPAGTITATEEQKEGPFVIHQIAIDPSNPQLVYAATSNYGILKSTDGGATWRLSNQGLGSYTHHAVVVNPLHPNVVYVGSWSGGVSKSVDRGEHWTGVNDGLGNTAIEDMVLDPVNPELIYVATTSGVFKSPDGGASWIPYSEGLPVAQIENFECLLALPSGPTELFLGTTLGLFKRDKNASAWEAINGVAKEAHIMALKLESKTRILFAGTVKQGLLQSRDGGQSWAPLRGKLEKRWVSDVVIDPRRSGILYASTRGDGIFKSEDGGATWLERSAGLPVKDLRRLALDPRHPEILFAGTTLNGLMKTTNGGQSWRPLTGYPRLSMAEIVASLTIPPGRSRASAEPAIPPAFFKCNQCHGWSDSRLNMKQTYWRVPPNKRDWSITVARMSQRARLTPEEARRIAEFLTRYTQDKQ